MTEAHLKKLLLTLVVAYERSYLDATILMTLLSPKTAVAGSYSIVENQEADAWRLSFPRCLPKAQTKRQKATPGREWPFNLDFGGRCAVNLT